MSFIIDDFIFSSCKSYKEEATLEENSFEAIQQLSKNFTLNQGAILLNSNHRHYQTLNKLKLERHQYSVRLNVEAKLKSVRVQARLLQEDSFKRITSKQREILLINEAVKRHFQTNNGYPFCIVKGCFVMVQKMYYFLFDPIYSKKVAEFYNSTFSKNFKEFQQFVSQQTSSIKRPVEKNFSLKNNFNEDLFFSQNLSNSNINFDISQDESKFQLIQQETRRKHISVKNIVSLIVQPTIMEQLINQLFLRVPDELLHNWLKDNLERRFQTTSKQFENMLKIGKFLGEKKIDDFIFNMVKITVKNVVSTPLGEGGSCQIFLAKAEMEFINSVDNQSYFKNDEKKEKVIAIKKLRPEFQKKLRNKLDHQKRIVSQLKGGVSYFIPKYYRAEQGLDRGDILMMEYIAGDQMDYFIACRQQTISLFTKLCLLINIVNGMRHLASYNITHLDLKPINIMVCKNNYLISKIIDFGQAHHPSVCDQNFSPGYTFPYVAPEVFIKYDKQNDSQIGALTFSQKQDIFSFGIIMYQVLFSTKAFLFTTAKYREIYSKKQILERMYLVYQKLEDYGEYVAISSMANLIIRCLDNEPSRRPNFDWLGISLRLILNLLSGTS